MSSTDALPRPGDRIVWEQLHRDGTRTERTGTVWDLAPRLGAGHSREVWVIPDAPLPTDPYSAVLVATVPKRGRVPGFRPGDVFSEDSTLSRTGAEGHGIRYALRNNGMHHTAA